MKYCICIPCYAMCLSMLVVLSGCAPAQEKTPCPHFGLWCQKTPVNHWNTRR